MLRLIQKGGAEAIGTFGMVFIGCGAAALSVQSPQLLSHAHVSLAFGLVASSMIYAVGHLSGAHFNPVVSLAFVISKHFPARQLLVYWVAQFTGAILAIGLLSFLFPSGASFGVTLPSIDLIRALVWEIVLTFFLVFVIIAVATDTRAEGTMAGAAIGATVTICSLVGGSFTGASMNPARTLGPALFARQFENIWIYFIGPAIGAALAAIVYRLIRCDSDETS